MKETASELRTVTVGRGCGFVVKGREAPYVITASDCLPWYDPWFDEWPWYKAHVPPPRGFANLLFRASDIVKDALRGIRKPTLPDTSRLPPDSWFQYPIYQLLAPAGQKGTIAAKCLFVDPISNIAVLGSAGDYEDESEKHFDALTKSASILTISDIASVAELVDKCRYEADVWVPGTHGALIPCTATYMAHLIGYRAQLDSMGIWSKDAFDEHGCELPGSLSRYFPGPGAPVLASDGTAVGVFIGGNENPRLTHNLPAWFLREVVPIDVKPSSSKPKKSRR